MKKFGLLLLVVGLVFSGMAMAGDSKVVTIEGKVMCAKCSLHEEGREACQNVVAVEAKGETTYYYLVASEANEAFGEVCMATPLVRATGTLEEKDGKIFMTATAIEAVEES